MTRYNIGILIKVLAKGILLFYACLVFVNAHMTVDIQKTE